jgi:trk system potassium uptake protein
MKIVILGAGQVGETIAENLVREDNDITLVDINSKRLQELQIRFDIQTVCGSATQPKILHRAGTEQADMLIAVTDSDEVNMLACFIAFNLFRTPKKIARIRFQDYLDYPALFSQDKLPIDMCISPEVLITEHITHIINNPGTSQVLNFADGHLQLVILTLQPGHLLIDKPLSVLKSQLNLTDVKIAAIFRNNLAVELSAEMAFQISDEIMLAASPESIQKALSALGNFNYFNRRIIIAGGGHIGRRLTQSLEENYRVKVIDHNLKRAEYLAENLTKATILHGDVSDKELLLNENIEFTDVFVSVTNDDETNIMSCLLAKKLGAKHVVSLINRKAYVALINDSAIDEAISPQLITIGSILTQLRRGNMINIYSLRSGGAEAIEVVAHGDKNTSKVIGRTVNELELPPETEVIAITRLNDVMLEISEEKINTHDHLILLVKNKRYIRQIEQLFQVDFSYFN